MSHMVSIRSPRWLAVLLLSSCLAIPLAITAQEPEPDSTPATQTEEKTAPSKPRGRLPLYYSRVVTPEQREEIYMIQGRFQKEIDRLNAELAAVEKARDQEVRDVLTPEQQQKVDELVAEAKKRREERTRQSRDSSPSDSDR